MAGSTPPMIYREFRPSPGLSSVVERLWWLEGPAAEIAAEPIPPDGRAEIIVHAGDAFAEDGDGGGVQDRVLLAGQATRAVRVMPRGFTRVVGARLRPDGAHQLFGMAQNSLTDRITDLRNIDSGLARRLRDDVTGREDGAAMVSALDNALGQLTPRAAPASQARVAMSYGHARRGLTRVPDMARHAGISVRQLERVFSERIGLPPKTYLRILRFQEVLRALGQGRHAATWASIAASHGYYDQAHFIQDFKTFVGNSPQAWNVSAQGLATVFSAMGRSGCSPDVAFFQDAPPSPR